MAKRTKQPSPGEGNFENLMMDYIAKGMTVIESLAQYGFEHGGMDAGQSPEALRARNVVLVRLLQTENAIRKMLERRE